MIILSWDVGIVNLAYCVLEYENNKIKILDWNIIDLIDRSKYEYFCCGTTKGKNICGNRASHKIDTGDNVYGYCRIHLKQHMIHVNLDKFETDHFKSHHEGECIFTKRDGNLCGKKSTIIEIKTGAKFCNVHYKSCRTKLVSKMSIQPIKKLNADHIPTSTIQYNLVKKMDALINHFQLLKVEKVIIENQPCKKNAKMKSIANTLYVYFLIRGQIDNTAGLKIDLVRFINASNKLKTNQKNTDKILGKKRLEMKNNNDKNVYDATKGLAITYTKKILADDKIQLSYLDLFKKQDDLCDAFLQGKYYLDKINKC